MIKSTYLNDILCNHDHGIDSLLCFLSSDNRNISRPVRKYLNTLMQPLNNSLQLQYNKTKNE